MSRFWNDAVEVFETASSAAEAGSGSDIALLVDRSGGLRIVMAEGWSPEGLQAHYGARTVYRVTHNSGSVCVEGRGPGMMSCTLRGPQTGAPAFRMSSCPPLYPVETRKLLR